MWKVVAIAVGGATGSVLRYLLSGLANAFMRTSLWPAAVFPWGTMAVNLIGSFAVGLLTELFAGRLTDENVRAMLIIGLLGGFTTFSALSYETAGLLGDGEWRLATANVVLSNVLGLAMVFLGFLAARGLVAAFK